MLEMPAFDAVHHSSPVNDRAQPSSKGSCHVQMALLLLIALSTHILRPPIGGLEDRTPPLVILFKHVKSSPVFYLALASRHAAAYTASIAEVHLYGFYVYMCHEESAQMTLST